MLVTVIIALTLAASGINLLVRPHVVSILFIALIFSRLSDFEAGRIKFCSLLWFIPIFIIWTNIHGGVLGGLATLALMISGWTLARILKQDSPIQNYRQAVMLWGFLIICISTVLINPYGFGLPKTWFSIMNSQVVPEIIQEHTNVLKGKDGWILFPLGVFFIFSLMGTFPKWPRTSWLIPLVWFALALSRVRHAPLFAILAALSLADVLPYVRWAKWLACKGSKMFSRTPVRENVNFAFKHALFPFLLVVITIIFQISSINARSLAKVG